MRDYRASARRGSKGGDDGPIRLGQRLYGLYEKVKNQSTKDGVSYWGSEWLRFKGDTSEAQMVAHELSRCWTKKLITLKKSIYFNI